MSDEKYFIQKASLCVTIGIRQSAMPSEKYYTKEEIDEILDGGVVPGSIPPASADTLGGIKVNNQGYTVDENGNLILKTGAGLEIDEEGNLRVKAYKGEYSITPGIEAQTLPTSGQVMTDDLEIGEIPHAEVTNPEGGSTFTIG